MRRVTVLAMRPVPYSPGMWELGWIALAVGVFAAFWIGALAARREWVRAALPLPAVIAVSVVIPSMLTWTTLVLSVAAGFLAQDFLATQRRERAPRR